MTKTKSELRGILVMTLSSVIFSVMSALVGYGSRSFGLDAYRMVLYRFAVGLALLGSLAMFRKIDLRFEKSWLLFFRGAVGGVGVLFYYLSITEIGVAQGTAISYSYPLFAVIGGALFLRERVGPRTWLVVAASFVGIYLTATGRGASAGAAGGAGGGAFWYAMAVLGALFMGAAIVLVKKLRESDSSYAIFYAQCAMGFWLVAVPASVKPAAIGYWGGAMLIAIGLAAAAAQLTMTWAYAHTTVSTGSLIGMLTPVFNIPVGWLLFGEEMTPRCLAGMAIVIGSCALLVLLGGRGAGAEEPSSAKPQASSEQTAH